MLLISIILTQAKAQAQKKVTISFNAEPLNMAVKTLREITNIPFAYNDKILMGQKAPIVKFTDQPLNIVLDKLLKDTGYEYKIIDGKVVIMPLEKGKSPNVQAGGGPGTIKGRIVEFETSQPLPGATIYLVELQKGMQSNNNGYYTFNNVPAGKYTLQISYVSFIMEKVTVEVKTGKEETYDIKMRGSNELNEVLISGTKKTRAPISHTTERQLVDELKAAQSVVSGISSEQISKSADRNAAEVVRKIAGVTVRDDKFIVIRGMNERYNLTYLNGNIAPSTELYSRAFSLDLIPTRIIDRILVYKSPAPDLLGDMTGGAVKIFTKDAKNVKHFDIELQLGYREGTTFNKNFLTYQGGRFDFLGFDDGTRKLPSTVPGYGDFTRANISQKTYVNSFSNVLNYGKETGAPPVQLIVNYYNSYKVFNNNLSTLTAFSYKNEPVHADVDRYTTSQSKASDESQNTQTAQLSLLQNFTYHLRDSSNIYFKNFLLNQGQIGTVLRDTKTFQGHRDGIWQDINPNYPEIAKRDIILTWSQRFLYSGNLGGSQFWGNKRKNQLDWNGGYTYSRLDMPDQRAIHLQNNIHNDQRIPNNGDYEQNWVTVFRSEDPFNNVNNNLNLGMISRLWIRNTEQNYNGSADYTYKFKPWITFKSGTYQQWKERTVYRRAYTVNEGDLDASGNSDLYNAGIGEKMPYMNYNLVFFHQQDLDNVWSNTYLRDDGTGLKVFDRTGGNDAYMATEQNNSGYAAISLLPFDGKLDIYGGVRVEYDRQKVAGAIPPNNLGDVNKPVLADLKSTQVLPSVNVGYRPGDSWVIRAAYGKTINRPEFRELSPYSELDYQNNQTVQGNSNLIFATANNYDARVEWYPNANAKGESVSLGGFYKNINNPIERVVYSDLNLAALPTQISFLNADKAILRGLELDLRKNLDFLPGRFFRDLSFIGNVSWIYSRATRTQMDSISSPASLDVKINRKLQGQAPYNFNAGLYYEDAGSGTKLALIYNEVGPRIYAAAIGHAPASGDGNGTIDFGSAGSLIELKRRQMDLSLTQRLVKSLQVKFSIQNLLNSRVQMTEDANFTYKYEKAIYTPTQPDKYGHNGFDKVSGDVLASDYNPGRFYLLSLTYSF